MLRVLANKIAGENVKVKWFVGSGCGRIRAKCNAWAHELLRQGCQRLIVVSDLDAHDLNEMRQELTQPLSPCPIQSNIVVIPVHEIEAWLLADHDAITEALKLRKRIKKQSNPESIKRPKERLRDLIHDRSQGKLIYLNTVHNERIAKHLNIGNVKRCKSFLPFERFIRVNFV